MSRACTVCTHPDSVLINEAIAIEGQSNRAIARQFSLHHDAIRRHRRHVPQLLLKASEAEEIMRADAVLEKIEELRLKAMAVLEQAEASEQHGLMLAAIDRASNQLKLLAQAMGKLHENQINVGVQVALAEHPGYPRLREAVVGALEDHPEAGYAVARALREIE
jgi:hypothetical protein